MYTHMHTHTHATPWVGCTWALEPCELFPASSTQAPYSLCDVVHHHGHRGNPDIAGDQAMNLLAGCVPELQSHLSQSGQEVQGTVRSSGWERGLEGSSAVLALPALGRHAPSGAQDRPQVIGPREPSLSSQVSSQALTVRSPSTWFLAQSIPMVAC